MTATERFSVEQIGRNYIAGRWEGKQLSHKSAFDIRNHVILFEVKTVSVSNDSNPKIHIAREAYNRKQAYDGSKYVAILAVVLVDGSNVIEARYGTVKQHCRFKSLMTEAEFVEAMELIS